MRSFLFLTALIAGVGAYGMAFSSFPRRSVMTMKRGRGSFQKEMGSGSGSGSGSGMSSNPSGMKGPAASASTGSSRNWITIPNKKMSDLPTSEANKVMLLETMAPALIDKGTNPTGAVAVMRYEPTDQTYCFSASCPSCKIPLTKANILEPNEESGSSPRVTCSFCKATYKVSTGDKLKSEQATGIFGSIAKTILATNDSGPLPTYALAEKNGSLLISLDK